MPIIFAQALMFLPSLIFKTVLLVLHFLMYRVFGTILYFCNDCDFYLFLYSYNDESNQMADELKRNGSFIPGVKPGKKTGFYRWVNIKIGFPRIDIFRIIAILPAFAMNFGIQQGFAYFFGGTSLLIMVGVY